MKPQTFELDKHEIIETEPVFDEVSTPSPPQKPSKLKTLFWGLLSALTSLIVTTWLYGYVEDLFKRSQVLGIIGAVIVGLLLLLAVIYIVKEWLSLRQIKQIENWRELALKLHHHEEVEENLEEKLLAHFAEMPTSSSSISQYKQAVSGAILNQNDKLMLLEKSLLPALDKLALNEVLIASKRVSLVTAVSPRAILDVAVVIFSLISVLKKIAAHYGLRPSTLGNLKLLSLAFSHVAVTAGLAIGDTLLSQLLGAGLAARLSAKLGEGVVNGLLTARFGLATIAICRPLPFLALEAPKLKDIVTQIVSMKNE